MWFYIGYTADDGSFQTTVVEFVGTLADGRLHYRDRDQTDVILHPSQVVWQYVQMGN